MNFKIGDYVEIIDGELFEYNQTGDIFLIIDRSSKLITISNGSEGYMLHQEKAHEVLKIISENEVNEIALNNACLMFDFISYFESDNNIYLEITTKNRTMQIEFVDYTQCFNALSMVFNGIFIDNTQEGGE